MDPLDILPEEMWRKIFGKLTTAEEGQDWLNLYRASPSFAKIFEAERQYALFPTAFSVLQSVLEEQEEQEERLNLQELLALRRVCRQWRHLVDCRIEKEESAYSWFCYERYHFTDAAQILSFLELFERSNDTSTSSTSTPPRAMMNPVIGRRAHFDYSYYDRAVDGEPMEEFARAMNRFLGAFGAQIQRLTLFGNPVFPRDSLGFQRFRAGLQNVLSQTPNLTWLSVSMHEFEVVDGGDDLSNMMEEAHPNNMLSNLQYFQTCCLGRITSSIAVQERFLGFVMRLCCRGALIKTAVLGGLPSGLAPPGVIMFPNLNNLSLTVGSKQEMFRLLDHSWPLSELSLTVNRNPTRWRNREVFLALFREVLGSIRNFRGSLKGLQLLFVVEGDNEDDDDYDSEFRVDDMPALKSLTIKTFHPTSVPTVYFTNLPSLEFLGIPEPPPRRGPDNLDRDWKDVVFEDMLESGIWEAIPSLNRVQFPEPCGAHVVSRDEWNQLKAGHGLAGGVGHLKKTF